VFKKQVDNLKTNHRVRRVVASLDTPKLSMVGARTGYPPYSCLVHGLALTLIVSKCERCDVRRRKCCFICSIRVSKQVFIIYMSSMHVARAVTLWSLGT
jgi:hypothetical protein